MEKRDPKIHDGHNFSEGYYEAGGDEFAAASLTPEAVQAADRRA